MKKYTGKNSLKALWVKILNLITQETKIERVQITTDTTIAQNTNYEIPIEYQVNKNELQVFYEGCLLGKGKNYAEIDSKHIKFLDWDVPEDSLLEFVRRKQK